MSKLNNGAIEVSAILSYKSYSKLLKFTLNVSKGCTTFKVYNMLKPASSKTVDKIFTPYYNRGEEQPYINSDENVDECLFVFVLCPSNI